MYFNFKNKIFISKLFLLFPLFMLLRIKMKLYFFTFLFALLHECAHFFTAIFLGEKASRLFINPYGFELKLFSVKAENEFKIILSGPLFSLILSILFSAAKNTLFSKINFLIAAINSIPALPLDGGRLLKIFLRKKLGFIRGSIVLRKISITAAFIIAIISFCYFNIWLLFFASIIYWRNKHKKIKGCF